MLCPICDRDNAVDARRCKSCGADFEDPEISAQLARPATAGDDDEPNLIGDRYLTIRWIGLQHGGDLRRVLFFGGLLFALAALLPVNLDLHGVRAVWSVLGSGPTVALVIPMVCAVLGLALASPLARGVPPIGLAGALVAGGLATLAFALGPLGESCAMPERVSYLEWLGVSLSAAAISIRVLKPRDANARWIAVAGAVLVLLGLFLPVTDARKVMPGEFTLYLRNASMIDRAPLGIYLDGFDNDATVRFLSLWHLLIIPATIGAALLCLPTPSGPWDSRALGLRPLGWLVVFWIPITLLFTTLNVMGWHGANWVVWRGREIRWDEFTGALFAGRVRMTILAVPAVAWLATGLTALRVHLLPERS